MNTYLAVNIIILRLLVQRARFSPPVNHPATHSNSGGHYALEELRLSGMAHGVNASLRNRKVDGFCEVERDNAGVPEV